MTPAEITQLITTIIAAGAFLLSMRSTSYTELKSLFETLKKEFEEYKEETKNKEAGYEKKIEKMEIEMATLEASYTATIKRLEKYIDRLRTQLSLAGVIPDDME